MRHWFATISLLLLANLSVVAADVETARTPPPAEGPSAPATGGPTQATAASHALRRLPEQEVPPAQPLPAPAPLASPSPSDILPGEIIPPGDARASDFPALPPDPYEAEQLPLPPLDLELWNHGGSHLYVPEGDRLNWPHDEDHAHYDLLRLPETWVEPKPLTWFAEFQGADPIIVNPHLKWPGHNGYVWEPRFVGFGRWDWFAFALEQNNQRQDAVGSQLLLELDLMLTGTERFHVQFRPLGERNTGGSFYRFSNPEGYEDNSTGEPQRYWFEGELHSIFGAYLDPFAVMDYNIVAGKFPFELHNSLLINDEFLGAMLSKNSLFVGRLSNLNVQVFAAYNDLDAFTGADSQMYGTHVSADYHREFYEGTYAFLKHEFDSTRDAHYAAFSRTKFYGLLSVAGRALFKFGDEGGRGSGQLFVLESNYTRYFSDRVFGVEKGVFYCNGFYQTKGWNSISGGNLNRLRTAFEVNPLIRIAAGPPPVENWGVAFGVQLFRHHEDESFIPEIAFESPDGEAATGLGLRYLRKTGSRSFFEALISFTLSDDPRFDREGVFTAYNILF